MARRRRMPFPRPLTDFLGEGVIGKGLAGRLREAEIWRLWPDIVGPALVTRSRPVRIINGVLTVAVSSAPWMQQLSFLKGMLRDKLNTLLGGEIVKEIVLKSGRVDEVKPEAEDRPRIFHPLNPHQKEMIDRHTAAIADPETRQAIAALMRTTFESGR